MGKNFENPRIFISHIHEDAELALKIQAWLYDKLAGSVDIFVSSNKQESIKGGEGWWDKIRENLKKSELVLVLLTSRALERRWIYFEAGGGYFLNKKVIPLLMRVGYKDLPPPLNQLQAVEISKPDEVSGLFHQIVNVCKRKSSDDGIEICKELNQIEDKLHITDSTHNKNSFTDQALLEGFSKEILASIKNLHTQGLIDKTKVKSQYINKESAAFKALTSAVKRAKRTIKSTRYSPHSILLKHEYLAAMKNRVLGSDRKTPLLYSQRIIAVNSLEKVKDVINHITDFRGYPFNIYLTTNQNPFELVIVDDTDVFIHFFQESGGASSNVITSTFHIKDEEVVNRFSAIYEERRLTAIIKEYNCQTIRSTELKKIKKEIAELFSSKS